MSCDIHAHVEIKINGRWHHFGNPNIQGNYALFGKLAGVRGQEDAIVSPRGFPDDATFETRFDYEYWGEDAHTTSWLVSEEVATVVAWFDGRMKKAYPNNRYYSLEYEQIGYIFGNGWDFKKYPRDGGYDGVPRGVTEARLVFWFDN